MAWTDPQSTHVRAARRLCVLGAGTAATAASMPAAQWDRFCFPGLAFGRSWLAEAPAAAALALALAVAVMLASTGGDATARGLLRRARRRAFLAAAVAAIYVAPLPFGPANPDHVPRVVYWSWFHQAGAVGALTSCTGALWWARALGRRLTDRPWRRSERRRTRGNSALRAARAGPEHGAIASRAAVPPCPASSSSATCT